MLYKSRYETYLEGIRTDIIKTLEKEEHTIESLRVKLGVNWKTVRDRLQSLQNEGVVCKKRVGKVNLYYLNPGFKKEEREP
jgi:predicted transcriptional regulator